MSEHAGRYQRSAGGLVGALLMTLLLVGAFVGWRALNRNNVDVPPTAVDYRGAATYAVATGVHPFVPTSLPAGWIPTSAQAVGGDRPTWSMGILTASGKFVGLQQQNQSPNDLVPTYVGQDAQPIAGYASAGRTWDGVVAGHNTGYSIGVGDYTVLVYGSAPAADLQRFIGLLVQRS